MQVLLHLLWLCLKGLLVYVVIFGAGGVATWFLFDVSDNKAFRSETIPGTMGGGFLLLIIAFVGVNFLIQSTSR